MLISRGNIIAVLIDDDYITCKVMDVDQDVVVLKALHGNAKQILIKNWIKAQMAGRLIFHRHTTREIVEHDTEIQVDLLIKPPNFWRRWLYKRQGCVVTTETEPIALKGAHGKKLVKTIYRLHRTVRGTLFKDGWFAPFPYQNVKCPFYLHTKDQTKPWNKKNLQTN